MFLTRQWCMAAGRPAPARSDYVAPGDMRQSIRTFGQTLGSVLGRWERFLLCASALPVLGWPDRPGRPSRDAGGRDHGTNRYGGHGVALRPISPKRKSPIFLQSAHHPVHKNPGHDHPCLVARSLPSSHQRHDPVACLTQIRRPLAAGNLPVLFILTL